MHIKQQEEESNFAVKKKKKDTPKSSGPSDWLLGADAEMRHQVLQLPPPLWKHAGEVNWKLYLQVVCLDGAERRGGDSSCDSSHKRNQQNPVNLNSGQSASCSGL